MDNSKKENSWDICCKGMKIDEQQIEVIAEMKVLTSDNIRVICSATI